MSTANELLATYAANEEHLVIGSDRHITVPDALKRIAVQYDHNIETVTFDCPRYWDEYDMSKMRIYINYVRADGIPGKYQATNIRVDEADSSIMHFDWTISRNVSEAHGKLTILICVTNADDDGNQKNHWNSELCDELYVSKGLECDDEIVQLLPDVLEQWHQEFLSMRTYSGEVEVT